MQVEKCNVLGAGISSGSFDQLLQYTDQLAERNGSAVVCFANAHMIVEANKDPDFGNLLNEADVVSPDGRPISVLMNWFYKKRQPRVAGMDFMPRLMQLAEKNKKTIFLYGSTQDTLESIQERARRELPQLKIVGAISPPFRPLTKEEDEEVVAAINKANPDYIFVSLGCPKQEKWMYDHKDRVKACMLGLGQAFLVYTGQEKRLPKWMRNLSLEWTYRLFLEPRRLWKRYLVTNSLFIGLTIKHLLAKNHKPALAEE